MLRCICGRRRSSTRCVRRVVSERLSSSSWNGGVTLGFSTSSSWHSTSTLPLVRLALSVPSGRAAHQAGDLEAVLVAHLLGHREGGGAVRVADHLHQALAVAQVDEDHAAVVAAAMRPAHQRDRLAEQRFAHQAAVRCSHRFHSRLFFGGIEADPEGSRVAVSGGAGPVRPKPRGRRAERLPGAQPIEFRSGSGVGAATTREGGATTPIEITYFKASSTLIASGITSARRTIRKKPEVGFGVVGT